MTTELIAVFAPLTGAILAGLFGRRFGDRGSHFITCMLMIAAAVCSVLLFADINFGGEARTVTLFTWIQSGELTIDWALRFDPLSCIMLFVINVVSCAVHVYSVGYMHHDDAQPRFMAYLSLFTFAMLMLVTSDNFVQLFFGWEGVGLASYLLIGFWNRRDSANAAAIKAFVVNRVGDFGLALGIMTVFLIFGSLDYDFVFENAERMAQTGFTLFGTQISGITLACILLFIGAMGKSAQLGLHTWLPDAMEGPTPVSALIHAATMVTAGVFLVARLSPLFEYAPAVQDFIAVVGALTALVAATIALTQFDIKRVIAYSTMSQLGYMFFALGVSAYGAAMFHLFTHAFFKALLFLGAGSVIHALSGEQDMRKMGGIWRMIPITYALMWIGNLALAGIPFFAGYYSKDLILEAAFADHSTVGAIAFWCGLAAALLTAFYSWRLLFMTFHGRPRAEEKVMAHVHESPFIMLAPLFVLAFGALFAGWLGYEYFAGHNRPTFFGNSVFILEGNDTVEAAHHVPLWVKILPIFTAAAGIALAWFLYIKTHGTPAKLAASLSWLHQLLYRKWYFDEIYHALFVVPSFRLGRALWKGGDAGIIDKYGPDGVAQTLADSAVAAKELQTGYVYHYAFATLIGVVGLVTAFVFLVRA